MTDRQQELLHHLEKQGFLSVKALSQIMYVSEPTIRRELIALESLGLISRGSGGAKFLKEQGELPLAYSLKTQTKEKQEIARQAARLVSDKSTVFVDASSTALYLLPHLAELHDLTIFTDGLETAQLASERGMNTYCIGGHVNPLAKSCGGLFAESMLRNLWADYMFFSVPGVSLQGEVMHHSADKASMLRLVMTRAQKRVLLCNSNKLGQTAAFLVCHANEIDEIICDCPLPASLL